MIRKVSLNSKEHGNWDQIWNTHTAISTVVSHLVTLGLVTERLTPPMIWTVVVLFDMLWSALAVLACTVHCWLYTAVSTTLKATYLPSTVHGQTPDLQTLTFTNSFIMPSTKGRCQLFTQTHLLSNQRTQGSYTTFHPHPPPKQPKNTWKMANFFTHTHLLNNPGTQGR